LEAPSPQKDDAGVSKQASKGPKSSNVDLNRLFFEDDASQQAFVDKLKSGPTIKPVVYEVSPWVSEQMTQSLVDGATHMAEGGREVSIVLSPHGIHNGFTAEQRKQLSDAGVKIQIERESLKKAESTVGLDALQAAGIPVKFYTPPWGGGGQVMHTKSAIFDGQEFKIGPDDLNRRNISHEYFPIDNGGSESWKDVDVKLPDFVKDWGKGFTMWRAGADLGLSDHPWIKYPEE
jgi:hypothetical protein